MTQQTPNLGLTYPEAGDHTRIWEHMQTLAEDVESVFGGIIQSGTVECIGTGAPTADGLVTFPQPFASTPIVVGAAVSNSYAVTSIANVTTTGVTMRIRRVDDSGSFGGNTTVHWMAFGVPA